MRKLRWKEIGKEKRVIWVAGHNMPHWREDRLKKPDLGTGEMVEKMCERFGGFGIIADRLGLDPNWDSKSGLRKRVMEIAREETELVVDIHGRKQEADFLIECIPNRIFKEIWGDVIKPDWKESRFKEDGQVTLVEALELEGVAAVEIEIRRDARVGEKKVRESVIEDLGTWVDELIVQRMELRKEGIG